MPITVEPIPNEAILLATFTEPFSPNPHIREMFLAVAELRDELPGSAFCILVDVRAVKTGFGDMVMTLGEVRQAIKTAPESDRDVVLAMIGSGGLIELAANAMKQAQYGNWTMPLFSSLEDAIAYAKSRVAGLSSPVK